MLLLFHIQQTEFWFKIRRVHSVWWRINNSITFIEKSNVAKNDNEQTEKQLEWALKLPMTIAWNKYIYIRVPEVYLYGRGGNCAANNLSER